MEEENQVCRGGETRISLVYFIFSLRKKKQEESKQKEEGGVRDRDQVGVWEKRGNRGKDEVRGLGKGSYFINRKFVGEIVR